MTFHVLNICVLHQQGARLRQARWETKRRRITQQFVSSCSFISCPAATSGSFRACTHTHTHTLHANNKRPMFSEWRRPGGFLLHADTRWNICSHTQRKRPVLWLPVGTARLRAAVGTQLSESTGTTYKHGSLGLKAANPESDIVSEHLRRI